MMKQIKVFILTFLLWILAGTASKLLFIALYHNIIDGGINDYFAVLWHGATLDSAIAGYLTVIPGLILIASAWWSGKPVKWISKIYFAIMAFVSSVAYVSNLGLYGYWGFPLDNTPLLYLRTSPTDAFASLTWKEWIFAPAGIIIFSAFIFILFSKLYNTLYKSGQTLPRAGYKISVSLVLFLLTAALIIPIRGGFGTGTNHTGTVYFSDNIRLNHAAVNPIFCFIESVCHQEEIGSKYRFMDGEEANRVFSSLTHTELRDDAERHDYNVILICLESFSTYILSETGNVTGVTPNLDKLSNEGIYFTNFYASSFRTDRALVSILSGFPAQPTMSVMDIPRLSTSLPSLAKSLSRNGYHTQFYYGGDLNYSNMNSYIIGSGFKEATSEYSFPENLRTGKWGVADEHVFNAMLDDIKEYCSSGEEKPFYKAIMTESSHEPFDVPYRSELPLRLNAFKYADHCLGEFIESLRQTSAWRNTLVVIVPDHLGAYPEDIDNYQQWRYHIPLILTGGVIKNGQRIDTLGSQTDICATVLGILGVDHKDFKYSKDLFDPDIPHFAFFSFPDGIGAVDNDNFMYYDNVSNRILNSTGSGTAQLCTKAKAYVQKLYDDLENRLNKKR